MNSNAVLSPDVLTVSAFVPVVGLQLVLLSESNQNSACFCFHKDLTMLFPSHGLTNSPWSSASHCMQCLINLRCKVKVGCLWAHDAKYENDVTVKNWDGSESTTQYLHYHEAGQCWEGILGFWKCRDKEIGRVRDSWVSKNIQNMCDNTLQHIWTLTVARLIECMCVF